MKHEKLHAVWREAHFQVKMYKAHHVRCCGAKHISKSKMYKTHHVRTTFGSCDVEKVHAVVGAKHISKSKCTKHTTFGTHFWKLRCRKKCTPLWARSTFPRCGFAWQAWGIHLAKWAKWGFLWHFQKRWASDLQRICKDAFSVAGAVQKKTCSWERLGGQGRWFPWEGFTFWSIRSVGLLRWFCVTGAALRMTWHQFFVAGAIL